MKFFYKNLKDYHNYQQKKGKAYPDSRITLDFLEKINNSFILEEKCVKENKSEIFILFKDFTILNKIKNKIKEDNESYCYYNSKQKYIGISNFFLSHKIIKNLKKLFTNEEIVCISLLHEIGHCVYHEIVTNPNTNFLTCCHTQQLLNAVQKFKDIDPNICISIFLGKEIRIIKHIIFRKIRSMASEHFAELFAISLLWHLTDKDTIKMCENWSEGRKQTDHFFGYELLSNSILKINEKIKINGKFKSLNDMTQAIVEITLDAIREQITKEFQNKKFILEQIAFLNFINKELGWDLNNLNFVIKYMNNNWKTEVEIAPYSRKKISNIKILCVNIFY